MFDSSVRSEHYVHMAHSVSATDARRQWSSFFSRAVHDRWPVLIERGRGERGLLIGSDELELVLSAYEFHPEALFEADAVSIWLPELALYGRGSSFDDAQSDLVEEVREYVDEYMGDAGLYLRAPNRADHFPFVLRAFVADSAGSLSDVLFTEPRVPVEA
jgi:hypothetical protein